MDEYGKVIGPGMVRIERMLPGPIERVWAYLTESEKRGQWLAEGEMEPRVGSTVELSFDHGSLSSEKETPEPFKDHEGAKGTEHITRWEPPHVLGLTWGPSEVTFELREAGDKVRLVLTHQKLPNRDWMIDVSSGSSPGKPG
ncbi:MAG: SRPBCC family protein [Candidatus Hydrogenedentes bacterium]|nr:SRPBCC family protein [Candidatus Hydrogenedentota bacterium]